MRKLFAVLVLAFLLCRPAQAEMTAQEYLQQPLTGTKHDAIILWLSGIEEGMYTASVYYESDGYPRLYCPPPHHAGRRNSLLSPFARIALLQGYMGSGNDECRFHL
jgi:hypothetical protein